MTPRAEAPSVDDFLPLRPIEALVLTMLYKVGHTEIVRQRQKVRGLLGAKFDVRAFNDTVVLGGNVPLDVPARNIDECVRAAVR